jgi:hypothetical protein
MSHVVTTQSLAIDAARSFGSAMTGMQHNSQLNQIAMDLGCSLLQFVGEVSPWTPISAAAARDSLAKLVGKQKDHVERLVSFLVDRGWPVDFGTYPAEYTDLHFLSLKALLPRMIANQETLVAKLAQLADQCRDDFEANAVVSEVLTGERSVTDGLKAISL